MLIGLFNSYCQQILLNQSALKEIPSDELDRVYIILLYPRYLTGILCICFIFMILFTTVTMSLFVCYQNHPEIKATSSVLSLCMFAGCYLLIVSTLNHTIASSVFIEGKVLRFLSCWGNDFLNNIGLDFVLATVFAKTLRIHYIFNKFGSKVYSDFAFYAVPFVCQIFLFLPKILPLLYNKEWPNNN